MLIGIAGKAYAGKDTVANIIHSFDPRFVKYSFAGPLKKAVNDLLGWDDRHAFGELKEVVDPYWGVSPRYAYQTFGTEWGRNLINKDLWLLRAQRELDKANFMVVPDVRFENELEWIRKNNGLFIMVTRPGQATTALSNHASEKGLDHMFGSNSRDRLLINTDLDILAKNVIRMLREDVEYLKTREADE